MIEGAFLNSEGIGLFGDEAQEAPAGAFSPRIFQVGSAFALTEQARGRHDSRPARRRNTAKGALSQCFHFKSTHLGAEFRGAV